MPSHKKKKKRKKRKLNKLHKIAVFRHCTTKRTMYLKKGKQIKVNPKIALAQCPEAVSRPWSGKGSPNNPSGPVKLRIQRSNFREVMEPIICREVLERKKAHRQSSLQKYAGRFP